MSQAIASQILQTLLGIAAAPLLIGWIRQCRAWLQNRRGAGVLQPYRSMRRLFRKEVVLAHGASPIFRVSPYVQLATMVLAASIVPLVLADLPFSHAADVIALVGLFATARVFMALAAMDIGTSFGSLGARREMLVAFLAEPAMLMVLLTASLISQSTSLDTIVRALAHREFTIYPSLAFAGAAFTMVLLAENGRIPVDNPTTHLELTMIHEAMILEYSGRHLALIEWATAIKLLVYTSVGIALFMPWGIAEAGDFAALPLALLAALAKFTAAGAALAVMESISAKMRIFRAPEFLATAFLLGVLGLLTHLVLER